MGIAPIVVKNTVISEKVLGKKVAETDVRKIADHLQNDINQTLAAVLLHIQSALTDKSFPGSGHLQMAEMHLKTTIKELVRVYYQLNKMDSFNR